MKDLGETDVIFTLSEDNKTREGHHSEHLNSNKHVLLANKHRLLINEKQTQTYLQHIAKYKPTALFRVMANRKCTTRLQRQTLTSYQQVTITANQLTLISQKSLKLCQAVI